MAFRFIVPVISIAIGIYIYLTQQTHPRDADVSGNDASQRVIIPQLIHGFDTLIQNRKKPQCGKVAVGYNANLDLIVHGVEVMEALKLPKNHQSSSDHEKLSSVDEFHQTFSHFFGKGSAAERFVDREPFDKIVTAASSLESKQWFTGGNAALMASRFAAEGCEVLLGGQVGKVLSTLLPPQIKVASHQSNSSDTNDLDEVHLIMEYSKFSKYGTLSAPRANRFITHSDTTNSMLTPMEQFHSILPSYNPSLLVISGLHLLEGQSPSTRTQRIADLNAHLSSVSSTSKVHLELASVGDMHFMSEIVSQVVPRVDSLGLNEQELASVSISISTGTPPDRELFKTPTPRLVIDTLKKIFKFVDSQNISETVHPLTRIHFHCLAFHLIVQRDGSMWTSNAKEAVAWGSIATTKQACDSQQVDPDAVELPMHLHLNDAISKVSDGSLNPADPVWTWKNEKLQFFLAPVMVCKNPTKTVGLGDAISTVALIQQVFA